MFEWMQSPELWLALLTLTVMEIVLGIDNLVFISILADKLPPYQQNSARKIGLALAVITRLILLFFLSTLIGMTKDIFTIKDHGFSGRDIVLILGGLFLIAKATHEIHHRLEGQDGEKTRNIAVSFSSVIIQVMILDMVFSLDSIITAVGMVGEQEGGLSVMVTAILLSLVIMLIVVESINKFIHRHPTVKMLALSFLLLIGVVLIADGFEKHIEKGYIYFAMAFSVMVEMLNIKASKKDSEKDKVELNQPYR